MKKRWIYLFIALTLLVVSGCSANATQTAAQTTAETVQFTEPAISDVQFAAQTAVIAFSGATATAEGSGVQVDGGTVTITAGGSYTLSGTLEGGQIIVDADKSDVVELVLNGASITSVKTAAIYAKQAGHLIITLADGTDNTLIDAAAYQYAAAAEDEPSAALYARHDLTIRGSGTLWLQGNYQNGITAKDSLVVESGIITVQAVNHGVRGKDSVSVLGGSLTITAGDDGIQADNTADAGSGNILIAGGEITITAAHDGMQAETDLTVTGGAVNVETGGGYTTESYSAEESYKGLKSGGTITVSGGEIYSNSLDDALHAGDTVSVAGGTLSLLSRDDGIHADDTVNITGGTIAVLVSYEGIEGKVISIEDGGISILAADDGMNAADTSQSGQGDRMGRFGGGGGAADASLQVNISGGTIAINAYGDGLDSNGAVTMTGGTLYISGPVSSANGALDYNGSFTITGGVLVAAGASGMAEAPGQNSAQASALVYLSQAQAAGSTCYLTDESGNVILSYTVEKEYQSIVFSTPALTVGSDYRVYAGEGGDVSNAALLFSFTQTGTLTTTGDGSMQRQGPQQNTMRRP